MQKRKCVLFSITERQYSSVNALRHAAVVGTGDNNTLAVCHSMTVPTHRRDDVLFKVNDTSARVKVASCEKCENCKEGEPHIVSAQLGLHLPAYFRNIVTA